MDKRQLYIDLVVDYCNRDKKKAEEVVDQALKRREEKRRLESHERISYGGS
jgi:hypothetical protein